MLTSEQAVQGQLDAYNSHDVDRFLAFYAAETVVQDGNGNVLMEGLDRMKKGYGELFDQSPELRCLLAGRSVLGEYVVDHEIVTGRKGGDVHAIVMYHVRNGKIDHVTIAKQPIGK